MKRKLVLTSILLALTLSSCGQQIEVVDRTPEIPNKVTDTKDSTTESVETTIKDLETVKSTETTDVNEETTESVETTDENLCYSNDSVGFSKDYTDYLNANKDPKNYDINAVIDPLSTDGTFTILHRMDWEPCRQVSDYDKIKLLKDDETYGYFFFNSKSFDNYEDYQFIDFEELKKYKLKLEYKELTDKDLDEYIPDCVVSLFTKLYYDEMHELIIKYESELVLSTESAEDEMNEEVHKAFQSLYNDISELYPDKVNYIINQYLADPYFEGFKNTYLVTNVEIIDIETNKTIDIEDIPNENHVGIDGYK